MERFFFDITYGELSPDTEGSLFSDIRAARAAAVQLLGEMLRDRGDEFWDTPSVTVTVKDETGLILWTIETMGTESALIRRRG